MRRGCGRPHGNAVWRPRWRRVQQRALAPARIQQHQLPNTASHGHVSRAHACRQAHSGQRVPCALSGSHGRPGAFLSQPPAGDKGCIPITTARGRAGGEGTYPRWVLRSKDFKKKRNRRSYNNRGRGSGDAVSIPDTAAENSGISGAFETEVYVCSETEGVPFG